jgi:hypothetical protein
MNRISGYNKTTTEIGIPPQTEVWNFYYGLTGIDKATRIENGVQNLTIDYSTDTKGNILSMNYVESGGYSGELFFTFDNFGNTSALTDTQGNIIVGYIYDLNNGAIKSEHNPQGIDNLFRSNNMILLKIGDITLIKDLESSSTVISNDCGIIDTLDAGVSPPYYVRPMQFVVWWLYYQEGWSITDLCECFPPYGFHPDKIRNAEDCDELEQIMKDAKYNWDEHVESWGKSGDITNESDVIGYLSFPMFDTPCQTMAWSGCEYWTAKDEWEKRGCK